MTQKQMNVWNETSTCVANESLTTKVTLGALLLFAIVVGGIGNTAMSFMILRHTEMRSVINILLAVMSMSDGCISFFCAPFDFTTIILHKWIFDRIFCKVHSFLMSVLIIQNLAMLVIISVDRYYILVNKKSLLSKCNALKLVLLCFAFAVMTSSPPVFEVGKFVFMNEHCGWSPHGNDLDTIIYFGLFSSTLLLLPCGLLLLAYVHILVNLRKSSSTIRPESHHEFGPPVIHQGIDVRFKQKTFTTIICLYLALIIFKLPMAVSLFIKSVTESVACPVSISIMVLTYLNSAVNPFIYVFKITTYWMVFTGKLYGIRKRVRSKRYRRSRSQAEHVYRVSRPSTSSII